MRIQQEDVMKSSLWGAELELEPGPVSSLIKKARQTRPLKISVGRVEPLKAKNGRRGRC
jgi:hypothetical protein